MKIDFKCNQNDNENIPIDIIKDSKVEFPNLHTNAKDISYISKILKYHKADHICKVPFCTTVEAEALGAYINLGDDKSCPRIKKYAYNSLDELSNIKNINFEKGRISEVLESINILSKEEIVTLNVCGPMTIISLLIDLKYFYKGVRKNKPLIEKVMKQLEDNIVEYIVKGYESGAKIISYSDPVGAIEIVGPKIYEDVVSKTTINIIKRISDKLNGCIIHLCGKTSTALHNFGICNFNEIKYDYNITYGEALCELLSDEGIKIVGNNCLKKSPYKLKNSIIYDIEFI
ncbi:MAG: uroporphyrinogen decarboxylase family protein [Peptostreptococcaceae bacterium]